MKKLLFSILFSFILLFTLSMSVNAECSYNERTQLLNESKKVDIFFDTATKENIVTGTNPNTGEVTSGKVNVLYFKMNFANISNNIFIKVINLKTGESFIVNHELLNNGVYSYVIDDISNIVNYSVTYYSTFNNCYAYEVYSKTFSKPKFNSISTYDICSNDIVAGTKYCKKFIDKEFNKSDSEILEYLNSLVNINEDNDIKEIEKKRFIDYLKKYWYIPTLVIILIVSIVVWIRIVKKRGELI